MEKIHKKLVRDKIPEIIKSNGEEPIISILDDKSYKKELYRKLTEECNEVLNSKTKEETLEELADVLEVMLNIAKLEDYKLEDVIASANKKREKRGGFEKKIYLEKTIY